MRKAVKIGGVLQLLGNDASNLTEWKTSSAGGNFSSWFVLLLGNLHLADEGGSPLLGCLYPWGCYNLVTIPKALRVPPMKVPSIAVIIVTQK